MFRRILKFVSRYAVATIITLMCFTMVSLGVMNAITKHRMHMVLEQAQERKQPVPCVTQLFRLPSVPREEQKVGLCKDPRQRPTIVASPDGLDAFLVCECNKGERR